MINTIELKELLDTHFGRTDSKVDIFIVNEISHAANTNFPIGCEVFTARYHNNIDKINSVVRTDNITEYNTQDMFNILKEIKLK